MLLSKQTFLKLVCNDCQLTLHHVIRFHQLSSLYMNESYFVLSRYHKEMQGHLHRRNQYAVTELRSKELNFKTSIHEVKTFLLTMTSIQNIEVNVAIQSPLHQCENISVYHKLSARYSLS